MSEIERNESDQRTRGRLGKIERLAKDIALPGSNIGKALLDVLEENKEIKLLEIKRLNEEVKNITLDITLINESRGSV